MTQQYKAFAYQATVATSNLATSMANVLINEGLRFDFVPLPDDLYEFKVYAEQETIQRIHAAYNKAIQLESDLSAAKVRAQQALKSLKL